MTTPRRAGPPPAKQRLIALNKPFGVLCQFTDEAGRTTLADVVSVAGVYAAGRLDRDSEGLLLLTNDGNLQHRISHPQQHLRKTYLAQVEGEIDAAALTAITTKVVLKDGPARALTARRVEAQELWPRDPPIRVRQSIPTSWLELTLDEGRNRQVRRMTAAVGFPTLRLVRTAIGPWALGSLAPGEWHDVNPALLPGPPPRRHRRR